MMKMRINKKIRAEKIKKEKKKKKIKDNQTLGRFTLMKIVDNKFLFGF